MCVHRKTIHVLVGKCVFFFYVVAQAFGKRYKSFQSTHMHGRCGYGSIPINTIFRGLFTSINPSYFDVNYRGTIGFDTLPCIAAVLDTVDRCLQVGRRVQNHPKCRARPGEDGTVPGTQSGAEDHGRGRHPVGIWGPW